MTPTALAANVKIRVEGKTPTIFGSVARRVDANALQALDAASAAGEFYYGTTTHVRHYVSQIGKYPAQSAGWVFKVNGVSPPVGADKVTLKDGDVVLWYYATFCATGGPADARAAAAAGQLLRPVQSTTPARKRAQRAPRCTADGKRFKAGRTAAPASASTSGSSGRLRPAPSARTP